MNSDVSAAEARPAPVATIAIATVARPGRDAMLVETLERLRGQLSDDCETLVIDFGANVESHENLLETLGRLGWLPSLAVEHSEVATLPRALNQITDLARGRFVVVIDERDLSLPWRIDDQLEPLLADETLHGTLAGVIEFDAESGQTWAHAAERLTHAALDAGDMHPRMLSGAYRRDTLRAVRYDEGLAAGWDVDLALRMTALGLRLERTGRFAALRRRAPDESLEPAIATARARLRNLFAREEHKARAAAAGSGPVADVPSGLTIAGHMPTDAGRWRIAFDANALMTENEADPLDGLPEAMEGDLETAVVGLDCPVMYVSDEIAGAAHAIELAKLVEARISAPVTLVASVQLAADRTRAFDWSTFVPAGAIVVRSEPIATLAELLAETGKIEGESVLRTSLHVVSEGDAGRPVYRIVFGPVEATAVAYYILAAARRSMGVGFEFWSAAGGPAAAPDMEAAG